MQNLKSNFEVTVPGKWILAGEHSVLRGSEALAFPLYAKYLKLKYFQTDSKFTLHVMGEKKDEINLIIWSVLEKAFNSLNLNREQITGDLVLESCIALGGGMGASATLCVAITKWLKFLNYIKPNEEFDFARNLENLFHGESSGVDVAVTLKSKPLVFTRNHGFTDLKSKSKPFLYLSYSGGRGVTKDCVDKVKNYFLTDPVKSQSIDTNMGNAVLKFKELLSSENIDLKLWTDALNSANKCFADWNLITDQVRQHQLMLIENGALAVKLTGSGGGGYVLSLWKNEPNLNQFDFELIPCFQDGDL